MSRDTCHDIPVWLKNEVSSHSYKGHWRYAPDSKQFLETRSEVLDNVTGTQGWCATLCHPKMHQHTKFGIPTSNNIGDMLRT